MSFSVYILRSVKSGKRYIGYTSDIDKRLYEHNSGINKSTCGRGPWALIYLETGFRSRISALKREKELKSWKGGIKLKQLIERAGIV